MLLATAHEANAKIFIHHNSAKEGQEVWFRTVFDIRELPDSAFLEMSTSGYLLAYINGRVAGTQSIWPFRPIVNKEYQQKQKGIACQSIDVRHLLRTGRNVLSIWYAPCIDMKLLQETSDTITCESTTNTLYQLSTLLTIKKGEKTETLCSTNSNWLCKVAPVQMTKYGEDCNSPAITANWKKQVLEISPDWIRPEKSWYEKSKWNTVEDQGEYAYNTISANLNEVTDSMQTYYFPYKATGQLRITLRNAKRGQVIDVNGMRYTCLGETDEQFFTRFSTITTDIVEISKTDENKLPNIQNLELILLKNKH